MKRFFVLLAALAAFLAIAAVASASVTTNPDGSKTITADSTGFVSKGDVQSAFGWNNAAFDAATALGGGLKVAGLDTTEVTTVTYTCDNTPYSNTTTSHIVQSVNPVYSSNGKQLTGWQVGPLKNFVDWGSNQSAFSQYAMCRAFGGTDGGMTTNSSDTVTSPRTAATYNGKSVSIVLPS